MIQLHPPLSDEHPPPQPVAAKSLMVTSILSEDLTVKFIYIAVSYTHLTLPTIA